jgi:hypothetical protein
MLGDALGHFFVSGFRRRAIKPPTTQLCGAFFGVLALTRARPASDQNNLHGHGTSPAEITRAIP